MGVLYQALTAGHVWLTAAGVFLAGLPHLECRCPAPTSSAAVRGETGSAVPESCCCGTCRASDCARRGDCCSSREPSEQAENTGSSPTISEIKPPHCTAELVQAEAAWAGSDKPAAALELTAALTLPMRASSAPLPTDENLPGRWGVARIPPPTDLVTMLQHFLI